MGERDRHEHGTFSWTDLSTPDAEASKAFYGGLFGWEFLDNPIPEGGVYVMAKLGGRSAAAMYETTERHPAWASYVTVDDADAITERAQELGANVLAGPFDVMDFGRMSTLQDPQGAVFCVWQAGSSIGAQVVNGPGALSLNQLNTTDPEAAQRFYTDLFGWRFEAMQGGPAPYSGIYRGDLSTADDADAARPAAPAPLARLLRDRRHRRGRRADRLLGGRIVVETMDVPGGHILVAQDPQGATFGLVAGRFDD